MHKNVKPPYQDQGQSITPWDTLIQRAKEKLARVRRRQAQLESLVTDFQRRRDRGEPSPFEVAKTSK